MKKLLNQDTEQAEKLDKHKGWPKYVKEVRKQLVDLKKKGIDLPIMTF